MLTRRHIFYAGAAGLGLAFFRLARPHAATAATHPYEVTHTDDGVAQAADAGAIRRAAGGGHRAAVHQPAP